MGDLFILGVDIKSVGRVALHFVALIRIAAAFFGFPFGSVARWVGGWVSLCRSPLSFWARLHKGWGRVFEFFGSDIEICQ